MTNPSITRLPYNSFRLPVRNRASRLASRYGRRDRNHPRRCGGTVLFHGGHSSHGVPERAHDHSRNTYWEFLPLDAAITFHKIVGITAGVFAAIHAVGHCINFYHVATQSQEGLACLFQEAVFRYPSVCDSVPSFLVF